MGLTLSTPGLVLHFGNWCNSLYLQEVRLITNYTLEPISGTLEQLYSIFQPLSDNLIIFCCCLKPSITIINSTPEVHGEGVCADSAKLHDHIAGLCLHLKVLH